MSVSLHQQVGVLSIVHQLLRLHWLHLLLSLAELLLYIPFRDPPSGEPSKANLSHTQVHAKTYLNLFVMTLSKSLLLVPDMLFSRDRGRGPAYVSKGRFSCLSLGLMHGGH